MAVDEAAEGADIIGHGEEEVAGDVVDQNAGVEDQAEQCIGHEELGGKFHQPCYITFQKATQFDNNE